MHVGFVLNPVAGMGGRVGLKGTDGKVAEARARGAEPRAPQRAERALTELHDRLPDAEISTWGDPMGADAVRAAGYEPTVLGHPDSEQTDSTDTRAAVEAFVDAGVDDGSPAQSAGVDDGSPAQSAGVDDGSPARSAGVDLVLFVGGDGTAADVAEALEGTETPMLGVPAGVKVYSSVFAVSPEDAAYIVASYERTERREVMDIDEDDYREGEVNPELRAVARVPVAEQMQSSKQLGGGTVEALAEGVADDIRAEPERTYVLGPGSTVGTIKEELGFEGSPIGVDVWRDGEVVARDASEAEILDALGPEGENVIIVSPIGGQGFVFGRGNPQLSPAVIGQCDVTIVASRAKLDGVSVLRADTDDPELDEELRGWWKVRVGKFETRMMKLV